MMKFEIGKLYLDRTQKVYKRITHWNHLPTFCDERGNLFVRNIDGKYRWDDKTDDRDITNENLF